MSSIANPPDKAFGCTSHSGWSWCGLVSLVVAGSVVASSFAVAPVASAAATKAKPTTAATAKKAVAPAATIPFGHRSFGPDCGTGGNGNTSAGDRRCRG